MSQLSHVTVYYTGRVQGVGFRYSTLQVAKEFEVSGFVTNLADGRVQVAAQGADHEVEGFLAQIAERMHGYIRKSERQLSPLETAYKGFIIR